MLQTVENIRDFQNTYQILKNPGANSASPSQNFMLFEQIDKSLRNIAQVQKLQKDEQEKTLKDRAESEIKVFSNLFKDLENLTKCLSDWNDLIISHFKSKISELNNTQKQLFAETDITKNLQQQLEKNKFEETQNQQKDETLQQDLQSLHLTMV